MDTPITLAMKMAPRVGLLPGRTADWQRSCRDGSFACCFGGCPLKFIDGAAGLFFWLGVAQDVARDRF
jgi:hypothetical protein